MHAASIEDGVRVVQAAELTVRLVEAVSAGLEIDSEHLRRVIPARHIVLIPDPRPRDRGAVGVRQLHVGEVGELPMGRGPRKQVEDCVHLPAHD